MEKKIYFTSGKGKQIEIFPLNMFLLDAFWGSMEQVSVPTYEIESVAGTKEVHEHTEKTLKTDEDKEAWREYVARKTIIDLEMNRRFFEIVLIEGTHCEIPGADSEWQIRQRRYGIKIPEDEASLKVHYITTEILATDEEIGDLAAEILKISGTNQEAVENIRKSFRSGVQEARHRRLSGGKKQLVRKKQIIPRA